MGNFRRFIFIAGILIVAFGIFIVWRAFFAKPAQPANVVALSGRIEGDDSAVAGKTSGRLIEVHFREGDEVRAGEVIAILDDSQVRAREEQAQAGVLQAEARLRSARQQIAIFNEQLHQNNLEKRQSEADSEGRVRQAEGELAAAEAQLAQEKSSYQLAAFDRDAYSKLVETGAVSERQGRQAKTTADAQEASVAAAQRRVDAARGALTTARSSLRNPDIRSAQVAMIRRQIAQQESEIASAAADEQKAKAQLDEARANRNDLRITAPFDGTVVTRTAEPGEMLNAGTPVVTLLDLRKVYLRGYVPEGEIGNVKIGQPARVYIDSAPDRPLDAYVLRIDPQATFTPENTYFQKDRVKQVVGVKLGLKTGFGNAKPGMPADAEILTSGDTWPQGVRPR
ncbi:MAG TPA: HlyD family efflux transporter periplasmic adaptor subunit [Bryobacteraceae bacterium]|jgi:HlyD family secretion protein